MPVLPLDSIRDTTLWKRLDQGFSGKESELAKTLTLNLVGICKEASDRMKAFPSLHPEYTLHDEVHLLRVSELMSMIMPEGVADRLNPLEIGLLILAAHFHDQGMVLGTIEIQELRRDPQFILFRDNWAISHPNLRDIEQRRNDRTLSDSERDRYRDIEYELHAALLTDYVRQTHGERSAQFVRSSYSEDPRWVVMGVNLAEFVARLCRSHVRPAQDLNPVNGFRYDEAIGSYQVNMSYLGLILRLADILDFDRDRTPDSLYKTIHFKSPVSIQEWEKHRSVDGWVIKPNFVQFTMRCEHPEYQRAAYYFMDWIDRELADAQALCRSFPASVARYTLELPLSADRSRIEPKDGAYIYSDLEFSLSRDEIVKILMTDRLYGDPSLCIRELLQNALDALRHRQALIRQGLNVVWTEGRVDMLHEVDADGYEIVQCRDNGIGMDRSIVERFLTRAGRSYYKSPEFEQERESFRAHGFDFDPCAQFGIGFMSCFMLGDRIVIETRRDNGALKGVGEPLIVEINGLSGIVVLRNGAEAQQAGTTVKIFGRRKPSFLDKYEDTVKMLWTLEGYALATEFPIFGRCTIQEIAGDIQIPPKVAVRRTDMEAIGIPCTTIDIPLESINPYLSGNLRTSFLIDSEGKPTLRNSEAEWREVGVTTGGLKPYELNHANLYWQGMEAKTEREHMGDSICMDGILVSGYPGRNRRLPIGHPGNNIRSGRFTHFLADIRGPIKPPLTPARTPMERNRDWHIELNPRWQRIQDLIRIAEGKLFEELASLCREEPDPALFWYLSYIYGDVHGGTATMWMHPRALWDLIKVPVGFDDGSFEWKSFSELPSLRYKIIEGAENKHRQLLRPDGAYVGKCPPLRKWADKDRDYTWDFVLLTILMSTVIIEDNVPRFTLRLPSSSAILPRESILSPNDMDSILMLPYSEEIQPLLSVHLSIQNINLNHPLAHIARESRYIDRKTDFQSFAIDVVNRLSKESPFDAPASQRWQKKIGHMHRNIDWSQVNSDLNPPYKVLTEGGAVVEVSHQTFEQWADLQVGPLPE